MDAQSITRGIAIIGMTTAARQMLDAAALMRTDESAALDKLADAIACAQEAYRAGSGNSAGEQLPAMFIGLEDGYWVARWTASDEMEGMHTSRDVLVAELRMRGIHPRTWGEIAA